MTGSATHRRIAQTRHQVAQRIRLQWLPHIGEKENLAGGPGHARIQRRRFAAMRYTQQFDALRLEFRHDAVGPVRRAVRDGQNLHARPGIVELQDRFQLCPYPWLAVVDGQQDSHGLIRKAFANRLGSSTGPARPAAADSPPQHKRQTRRPSETGSLPACSTVPAHVTSLSAP